MEDYEKRVAAETNADNNKKPDLPGSSTESMEEYERRVAAETNDIINQEIRTQRINGQPIRGRFSSHVVRDDDGHTITNVTMRGVRNRDYCYIAWMYIFMQIYHSVVAQVRLKFAQLQLNICVNSNTHHSILLYRPFYTKVHLCRVKC